MGLVISGGSPDNSGTYREIINIQHRIDNAVGSAASPIALTGSTNGAAGAGASAFGAFYFDPTDYGTVSGKTLKVRTIVDLGANATASTVNWTVGLYPVSGFQGGANAFTLTGYGTVVSGSTALFTAPAANAATRVVNTDITAPTAGFYTFGIINSGSPAANSSVYVRAHLQVRFV